jgi:hypothetical protein
VIEIDGQPVLDYIDVRVNCVVGGYRIAGSEWSQRFGDHASEQFLKQTSLDMLLIPKGSASGTPEPINVPFVATFLGNNFADGSFVTVNSVSHPRCTISSLHSVMSLISSFLQCSRLCVGVVLVAGVDWDQVRAGQHFNLTGSTTNIRDLFSVFLLTHIQFIVVTSFCNYLYLTCQCSMISICASHGSSASYLQMT